MTCRTKFRHVCFDLRRPKESHKRLRCNFVPRLSLSSKVSYSMVFAAVIWLWKPWGWQCPAVFIISSSIVAPCACSVFIALLVWHCGLNFSSLAVLSILSLSPPPQPVFSFLFIELSGSSVTGAWGGSGVGGPGVGGLVAWLQVGQASRVF